MNFPDLPYKTNKVKKLITKFLGLNFTDNFTEGEFVDTQGLSSKNYPTITQREGRDKISNYENVTDLFEWNGKLVVIDNATLYYDGVAITNVTPGKKQFAVVNTHLLVFPDQIDIDLESSTYTFKHLTASLSTAAGTNTSTFNDGNKVTGQVKGYIGHIQISGTYSYLDGGSMASDSSPLFYTYGTNKASVDACWVNGAWDQSALAQLQTVSNLRGVWGGTELEGRILIPKFDNTYKYVTGKYKYVNSGGQFVGVPDTYPDVTQYNNAGIYMIMHYIEDVDVNAQFITSMGYHGGVPYYTVYFSNMGFDLYSADSLLWSDAFRPGDSITCTGASEGYNFENAIIDSIDDATNTMTFKDTPFSTTTRSYSRSITFTAQFPELDFICEKGNRLWGVSNADRTIYASALGIPSQMYSSGTDADAYQVAVGSEGDFTGIANFGGAVCCFKERKVHKVLGDVPSNFYMTDYTIDGVQKGSDKSLVNINETLYYKGVNGVYAFSGSIPTLISSRLGRGDIFEGVGGSDGERYYLHVKDSDFNHYLLVYDLLTGLWIKEDNISVSSFTMASNFYMASNGSLYRMLQDNNEEFDWYGEFVPFYSMARTTSSYTRSLGKQGYSKIVLGFEMEKGSRFSIDIKEDNKQWKRIYTKVADSSFSTSIPIMIGRCDIFKLKISGHGRVKIFALQREYSLGSEV